MSAVNISRQGMTRCLHHTGRKRINAHQGRTYLHIVCANHFISYQIVSKTSRLNLLDMISFGELHSVHSSLFGTVLGVSTRTTLSSLNVKEGVSLKT